MKNAARVMQLNIQIPQTIIFLMVNDAHHSKSGGGGQVQGSASIYYSHDLRVPVGNLSRFKLSLPQCNVPGVSNCMSGFLACIDDICVLAMKIISIDRTQRSIPVQTPSRKFRGCWTECAAAMLATVTYMGGSDPGVLEVTAPESCCR